MPSRKNFSVSWMIYVWCSPKYFFFWYYYFAYIKLYCQNIQALIFIYSQTDHSFYFTDPLPFGSKRSHNEPSERICHLQSWHRCIQVFRTILILIKIKDSEKKKIILQCTNYFLYRESKIHSKSKLELCFGNAESR